MNLILLASEICRKAHAGQVRKYTNEQYANHPARVASRVSLLPNATEEMVAAAYLHDVLEDTTLTEWDLEKLGMSDTVIEYVIGLTDQFTKTKYPSLNREKRKTLERQRLADLPSVILNIKMADIIDNLRGQDPSDPFAPVFLKEKEELLLLVFDKIDPELRGEVETASRQLRILGSKLAPKYWGG